MSEVCQCEACVKVRRWEAALNLQTDEAKEAFQEMLDELVMAETDAAWAESVLTGKWPDSELILETALEVIRRNGESSEATRH